MAKPRTYTEDLLWQRMIREGMIAGSPVHYLQETGSTNTIALERLEKVEPRTVVVAEYQSQGRGRLGRKWESPTGTGLYFSLILQPQLAVADLPKITLAAGVATARGIEKATGIAPQLKWPNDILVGGGKVGGILTESGPLRAGGQTRVVVGIGINVSTGCGQFAPEIRQPAISLQQFASRRIDRGPLLEAILAAVKDYIDRLEKGRFADILARWKSLDAFHGQRLSWVDIKGTVVSGISLGPDENGILHILDDHGQVHEILSGDVTLAPNSK